MQAETDIKIEIVWERIRWDDDEDEFGEPREFASKIAVKKIAEDIINDIMTTW